MNSLQRQFETVIRIAGSYEKLPSEELLIALADRVVPSNVEELLRILDTLGFDNPG